MEILYSKLVRLRCPLWLCEPLKCLGDGKAGLIGGRSTEMHAIGRAQFMICGVFLAHKKNFVCGGIVGDKGQRFIDKCALLFIPPTDPVLSPVAQMNDKKLYSTKLKYRKFHQLKSYFIWHFEPKTKGKHRAKPR